MGAKPGPYRKPTQVGEASSLRCTGEPWRRNSAKSPRNFGTRGASGGEGVHPEPLEAAAKGPKRLFNKNTGRRKSARRRMSSDTCPVPEG